MNKPLRSIWAQRGRIYEVSLPWGRTRVFVGDYGQITYMRVQPGCDTQRGAMTRAELASFLSCNRAMRINPEFRDANAGVMKLDWHTTLPDWRTRH